MALAAHGQDSPSLGDVARQTRLQKQQQEAQAAKEGQSKDGKPVPGASAKDTPPVKSSKRVITNEEIPEHIGPTQTNVSYPQNPAASRPGSNAAELWKAQFLAQKQGIATLEKQIDEVSASIQYSGSNCVVNCVQWNEQQKRKQDQVESMKAQLEQMQANFEAAQEAARKQGFGSSVYDP